MKPYQLSNVHVIHINRSKKPVKQRTDKQDKHTIDQVLDYRTRKFIFDLTEYQQLTSLESLVNSGKEANVYISHSPLLKNLPVAVKIYSTSKMSFKNRQIYIEGDRRFQALQAPNSRKLIHLWAEKEFRNAKRIYDYGGIYFPRPITLHENVLVEEFIGYGDKSALRLVDIAKYLTDSRLNKIYYSILRMVRDLYQKCHLVHGDLSEYNMLFKDKKIYLIDVGYGTDFDSSIALTLLRKDLKNINVFFAKMCIPVVKLENCLAFVMSSGVPQAVVEATDQLVREQKEERRDYNVFKQDKTAHAGQDGGQPSKKQIDYVTDCCGPNRIDKYTVAWLRDLRAHAVLTEYEQIQLNDEFVQTSICQSLKETGEFMQDKSRLQNLGVEVIDEVVEEEFETEEVEEPLQNVVYVGNLQVNLDQLRRNDYSKEDWKQIQKFLKERDRLKEKKPKSVKKREKAKAMKKRRGQ